MCPETAVWYFGFGAMVNPISRTRRGLPPDMNARPAKLPGFKLVFTNGTGDVAADSAHTVHGVLMRFDSQKDWETIEKVETPYQVREGDVLAYDDERPVRARYFQFPDASKANTKLKLPSERYLRVIADGLQHHGVDPDYISWLKNQPSLPSVDPNDYKTIPVKDGAPPESLPTIGKEEYSRRAFEESWFRFGKTKIVKVLNHDNDFYQWLKVHFIGNVECGSWALLQIVYEPNLPDCKSSDEMLPEHYAWAENELLFYSVASGCLVEHLYNLEANS